MGNAERVELGDRAEDRGGAVIDVVGEADRVDPAEAKGRAGRRRIGKKTLGRNRVPLRRPIEAAFEIGEAQRRAGQRAGDARERDRPGPRRPSD